MGRSITFGEADDHAKQATRMHLEHVSTCQLCDPLALKWCAEGQSTHDAMERWVDDAQAALNNEPACEAVITEGEVTLQCDRHANHTGPHRQLMPPGTPEQLWFDEREA
jgi:hypothetical protein